MRFRSFVAVVVEIAEHWPCIDATINTQQRGSDILQIALRERPKATVRVSILGTNSRMQHKGAGRRNLKDLRLEDGLAPSEHKVWTDVMQQRNH